MTDHYILCSLFFEKISEERIGGANLQFFNSGYLI
jgi:hypothetical protein